MSNYWAASKQAKNKSLAYLVTQSLPVHGNFVSCAYPVFPHTFLKSREMNTLRQAVLQFHTVWGWVLLCCCSTTATKCRLKHETVFKVVSVKLVLSPLIFRNLVLCFDAILQHWKLLGDQSWQCSGTTSCYTTSQHMQQWTRSLCRGLGTKLTLPKAQLQGSNASREHYSYT